MKSLFIIILIAAFSITGFAQEEYAGTSYAEVGDTYVKSNATDYGTIQIEIGSIASLELELQNNDTNYLVAYCDGANVYHIYFSNVTGLVTCVDPQGFSEECFMLNDGDCFWWLIE